jgi:hypothetical protein
VESGELFELSDRREVDILFLVDKSPTMEDEQASLAQNFPRFIEVLENIEGGLPDIHLGVITQDIGAGGYTVGGTCSGEGDGGRLQNTARIPGCRPPSGAFIRDVARPDGTRDRNYAGTLAETFACIAQVGPRGCGFEQHLLSLKMALDGSVAHNAGFLRKDAHLAVVILSDEDDCSASDPRTVFDPTPRTAMDPLGTVSDWRCAEFGWVCDGQTPARGAAGYGACQPNPRSPYLHHPDVFVDFVRGLKADPGRILVATIMGPSTPVRMALTRDGDPEVQPSCQRGPQNAEPMPRIEYFADRVSDQSTFVSICEPDLSGGLVQIAEALRGIIGVTTCLSARPADTDPKAPGLQAECSVTEITGTGPGGRSTPLPRCSLEGDRPCWKIADDSACSASGLTVDIERGGAEAPAEGRLSVKCLTR